MPSIRRPKAFSAPKERYVRGTLVNIAGFPKQVLQSVGSKEEGNVRLQTSNPPFFGCMTWGSYLTSLGISFQVCRSWSFLDISTKFWRFFYTAPGLLPCL
jgi:hypothetical protein